MNFIQPSVKLINETDNFKRIEKAARICYKSEDRISNNSAYPFFQRMAKNGHTSTLEHSVIYVRTHEPRVYLWLIQLLNSYIQDTGYQHYIRFSKWDNNETMYQSADEYGIPLGFCIGKEHLFSGNIRAWRKLCEKYRGEQILKYTFSDHPAFSDIFDNTTAPVNDEYSKNDIEIVDSIPSSPNEFTYAYMHYPVTLHIIADRGVIDEFARHRVMGISVESTRYCSYKDSGITFVFPYWFEDSKERLKSSLVADFGNRCYDTEVAYQESMKKCNTPQIARGNLTLWVKSEIAMTGTIQNWIDLLKLRDSPAAHPDAQKIAKMIEKVLVEDVGVNDIWGVSNHEKSE